MSYIPGYCKLQAGIYSRTKREERAKFIKFELYSKLFLSSCFLLQLYTKITFLFPLNAAPHLHYVYGRCSSTNHYSGSQLGLPAVCPTSNTQCFFLTRHIYMLSRGSQIYERERMYVCVLQREVITLEYLTSLQEIPFLLLRLW